MFRGSQTARVDDKGRLKLPVDFKRFLDEEFKSDTFYVTSRDGRRGQLYPMREWEVIEAKMAAMPDSDLAKRKLVDITNYYGQVVELDGQGRLTLPQVLREKLKLTGEVMVLGSQRYMEVVHRETFEGGMEADPINAGDLATLARYQL
jgi:MraZ protein